jgi:hypothetical protein
MFINSRNGIPDGRADTDAARESESLAVAQARQNGSARLREIIETQCFANQSQIFRLYAARLHLLRRRLCPSRRNDILSQSSI